MDSSVSQIKKNLRVRMRKLNLAVDSDFRKRASQRISKTLLNFVDGEISVLQKSGAAIFKSYADEIELGEFEEGLILRKIPYEVLTLDHTLSSVPRLVIVPGVAFDDLGNRLGRGKGYYDRLISTLPCETVTIGVGYDHQLVDSLPIEAHDRALDFICTPTLGLRRSNLG